MDRDAFGVEIETVVSQSEWLSVRSIGPQIQNHDAALVAAVNGMMEWHTRNLYCGKTGQVMIPTSGGYARKLENSNRKTEFPRIDPAIICLVTSGDYCLLGRKPVWRERTRYHFQCCLFALHYFGLGIHCCLDFWKSERR